MPVVKLSKGKVYRTRDLKRWAANPTRLASQLVADGQLVALRQGLYVHPRVGRFGPVPPEDGEILRAFLGGDAYVETGPPFWNALGLGTTALHAHPLIYNRKRSGTFTFGNRSFVLRRVAFPRKPTREWFVIDLFENASSVGAVPDELAVSLARSLARGEFDAAILARMAQRYGSRSTQALVARAMGEAART